MRVPSLPTTEGPKTIWEQMETSKKNLTSVVALASGEAIHNGPGLMAHLGSDGDLEMER